jgi:4-hydroxy-tetrahydrodipicolinate synthase
MKEIKGAIPALITPFTGDGKIDEDALRKNIRFVTEGGVSAICPCGTTGEAATLTHDEHKKVIDISVDEAKIPVIAGTGSNSTQEAIDLTKHAENAGADAALLITPYYNKPNRAGLINHFKSIAESADIPLILYNIPSRTGQNVLPEIIAELAELGCIVGVKEASGNLAQVSKILRLSPKLSVLSGDDSLTLPIIAVGGKGVISVAANLVPKDMSGLVDSALRGDFDSARKIHYRLLPLFDALFLETNPIPVKKAAELLGMGTAKVRLPLEELSQENEKRLKEVLSKLGLL